MAENNENAELKIKEFGVKDANEASRLQRRIIIGNSKVALVLDAQNPSLDELEAAEAERDGWTDLFRAHICKQIVSLPASWLVEDAPANLDWKNPDSAEYIRASKWQAIADMALGRIQAAKDNAKN